MTARRPGPPSLQSPRGAPIWAASAARSRIISPPQIAAVAQSIAATTREDLERLQTVLEEAQGSDATADEVAAKVEEQVPSASVLASLLKDGGVPLAVWLTFLVTLLGAIHPYLTKPPAQPTNTPAPTVTPAQVEEIIERVVEEVEAQPPPDQPRQKPKAEKQKPKARPKKSP